MMTQIEIRQLKRKIKELFARKKYFIIKAEQLDDQIIELKKEFKLKSKEK